MGTAIIREENITIPTYAIGKPEKMPIFLENRVYQGSSGKIYPYPTIEEVSDTKRNKIYHAVILENEYLKILILPELGGRIQRAYDKTNGYDFVYYNHVIKPALVGLCGPWISGGIEFNWPQHHRPTTFSPVDYTIERNQDGSVTCTVHDFDRIYGTEVTTYFTLYSGKSRIEIKSRLYNGTPLPQTFLWWANPAVAVNDYTQSIFPPDVHAVMDHGKRDVSRFPIATGIYYKHDYSEGVDISKYRNIPVPTSYMAEKSKFDFVGGYDYRVKAGLLHVADHHVSPGKKQWTWGCGNFGKAWDRNLTDDDGPYIELMTGVYTDNQPDFSWLKPMEEKTFTQYFMPYKAVGPVKNATVHACVNLEVRDDKAFICVYASEKYDHASVTLTRKGKTIFSAGTKLSPMHVFQKEIPAEVNDESDLTLRVTNGKEILVEYTPLKKTVPVLPKPAEAAKDPQEIFTNEELYLTGLHIEQYRHATYRPDPYYLEGLKRDPEDIRINTAYGMLLLRRGLFEESEKYFRSAIKRATWKNPNPYTSEPYYDLGLSLYYQKKYDGAYDAFYKATWSNEQQEMSYYYLACIAAMRNDFIKALDFCEKGLVKNSHNIKARSLRVFLLRKLELTAEAKNAASENLRIEPFDFMTRLENTYLNPKKAARIFTEIRALSQGNAETSIRTAIAYAEAGAYDEAIKTLTLCKQDNPMLFYYRAYYRSLQNKTDIKLIEKADSMDGDYVFPNRLEDIAVLRHAIREYKKGSKAPYYLGNLYYDRYQYDEAGKLWEYSAGLKSSFPIVWRNLALVYYNKMNKPAEARKAMEKAFSLAPESPRIFMELDQLSKKLNMPVEKRLAKYEASRKVFMKRDDLIIEYVTLLNMTGKYQQAYDILMSHRFHPWEGGEGKATTQYTISLISLARQEMHKKRWDKARDYLHKALVYPENLGEGKLEGCKDNHINYYLGIIETKAGHKNEAKAYFDAAGQGTEELAGVMYYNDQPADMIYYQGLAKEKLGKHAEANSKFYKLIDYGEKHLSDHVKIGYFAVSLPDFQIFDADLDRKNHVYCLYLIGLGKLGLGDRAEAAGDFREVLKEEASHQNAWRYLRECTGKI